MAKNEKGEKSFCHKRKLFIHAANNKSHFTSHLYRVTGTVHTYIIALG